MPTGTAGRPALAAAGVEPHGEPVNPWPHGYIRHFPEKEHERIVLQATVTVRHFHSAHLEVLFDGDLVDDHDGRARPAQAVLAAGGDGTHQALLCKDFTIKGHHHRARRSRQRRHRRVVLGPDRLPSPAPRKPRRCLGRRARPPHRRHRTALSGLRTPTPTTVDVLELPARQPGTSRPSVNQLSQPEDPARPGVRVCDGPCNSPGQIGHYGLLLLRQAAMPARPS